MLPRLYNALSAFQSTTIIASVQDFVDVSRSFFLILLQFDDRRQ